MHEGDYEEYIQCKGYGRIDLHIVVVGHNHVDMVKHRSCLVVHTYSIEVVDGHVADTDVEYFEFAPEDSSLNHQNSSLRDLFVLVEYAEHVKLD